MRTGISLDCKECKRKNYTTKKNKQKTPDKIQLKKILQVLPEAYATSGR